MLSGEKMKLVSSILSSRRDTLTNRHHLNCDPQLYIHDSYCGHISSCSTPQYEETVVWLSPRNVHDASSTLQSPHAPVVVASCTTANACPLGRIPIAAPCAHVNARAEISVMTKLTTHHSLMTDPYIWQCAVSSTGADPSATWITGG